jgi:hypothetical protein
MWVYYVILQLPETELQAYQTDGQVIALIDAIIDGFESSDHDRDIEVVEGDGPVHAGCYAILVKLPVQLPITPDIRQFCIEDAYLRALGWRYDYHHFGETPRELESLLCELGGV